MIDVYVTKVWHFETQNNKTSVFWNLVKFVASCSKLHFRKVTRKTTNKILFQSGSATPFTCSNEKSFALAIVLVHIFFLFFKVTFENDTSVRTPQVLVRVAAGQRWRAGVPHIIIWKVANTSNRSIKSNLCSMYNALLGKCNASINSQWEFLTKSNRPMQV